MRDLRKELREGKTLLGTFVWEFSSPHICRVLASCGWDFILVDTEHTSLSVETVGNLVATANDCGLPSIVRVPSIERPYFSRPLDAGAAGIMVPRIETPEEVKQAVSFIKFPPRGTRGVGFGLTLTRYQMVRPGDHANLLNETTLVVLQIETKAAVERMDEILSNQEVDVAYVGPFDLSHSLGIPGEFDHPLMTSTMEQIIAGCERNGVVPGVYAHAFEAGRKWMDKGMRFFVCSGDVWLLKQKSLEVLECYRSHLEKTKERLVTEPSGHDQAGAIAAPRTGSACCPGRKSSPPPTGELSHDLRSAACAYSKWGLESGRPVAETIAV